MLPILYTDSTVPADALATLGARASAGMVLTPNIHVIDLVQNYFDL